MGLIYHIAARGDWEAARRAGEYRMSTRGRSLAEVGFIHASTRQQVAAVANAFYRDASDLLVLVIDPGLVTAEIRYEHVPGSKAPFPHIYGPLNTGAVIGTRQLGRDSGGAFTFPAGDHGPAGR
jgi:uncharacterized protein (DUF952 family)